MVTDTHSGSISKIEPRLMQLLLLLAANQGATVSRERIAKEIWNDYPGAGEGMNQAVSALRKLLHDEGKQLIQTIPKKGYCLHAQMSKQPTNATRNVYLAILASFLVVLSLAYYFWPDAKPPVVVKAPVENKSTHDDAGVKKQKVPIKEKEQVNVDVKTSVGSDGKMRVNTKVNL